MENDFYVVDNIVTSKYLIFPTIESARHYMMKEYILHFKDWFGPTGLIPIIQKRFMKRLYLILKI